MQTRNYSCFNIISYVVSKIFVGISDRVARWLSQKYRTLTVPMSVAQHIELFMHTRINCQVLYMYIYVRYQAYSQFNTGQRAKLPENLVKYRTPGNPNLRKENQLMKEENPKTLYKQREIGSMLRFLHYEHVNSEVEREHVQQVEFANMKARKINFK